MSSNRKKYLSISNQNSSGFVKLNNGSASIDSSTYLAASNGTVDVDLNLSDKNLSNLNNLAFNDPGPNEGIEWVGGSGWKIYESPNDLTTNSAGNLQFVQGSTRAMTLNTSNQLDIVGGLSINGTLVINSQGVFQNIQVESPTYVHDQTTPASTWTIDHTLGKVPSVTVVDSAGSVVFGDIQIISSSRVILEFGAAFSGKAYLN
jgi:hypothetical protein